MKNGNKMTEKPSVKGDLYLIKEKDISVLCQHPDEEAKVHVHDCYEFEILIAGEMDLRFSGKSMKAKSGSFWLTFPNDVHHVVKNTEDAKIICIRFMDTLLSNKVYNLLRMYGDGIKGCVEEGGIQIFLEMVNRFVDTYKSVKSEICRGILIKSFIEAILVVVVDKCDGLPEEMTDEMAEHNIFEAVSYIKNHFTEDLSANDMAKRLGYTPNYFSMKFKSLTGKNFVETVNDERLQLAYYMLSTMNISVGDVAEYVGYSSLAYFSRMFKKKYNKSPRDVKKTEQKG